MVNEHNARWASSIWFLFRIDHNTISPSLPTSTTSTSPTGWSDIYLIIIYIIYRGNGSRSELWIVYGESSACNYDNRITVEGADLNDLGLTDWLE